MFVKVKNAGSSYSKYSEWAEENGLKNYAYGESLYKENKNNIYKVIAINNHYIIHNTILYGIENELGKQFIINKDGTKEIAKIDNNKNYMLDFFR
jgi:hypothetical protein